MYVYLAIYVYTTLLLLTVWPTHCRVTYIREIHTIYERNDYLDIGDFILMLNKGGVSKSNVKYIDPDNNGVLD